MSLCQSFYVSLVNSLSHSHDHLCFFHYQSPIPFSLLHSQPKILIHWEVIGKLFHLPTNKSPTLRFFYSPMLCPQSCNNQQPVSSSKANHSTCALQPISVAYTKLCSHSYLLCFPSVLLSQLDYFHQHINKL